MGMVTFTGGREGSEIQGCDSMKNCKKNANYESRQPSTPLCV